MTNQRAAVDLAAGDLALITEAAHEAGALAVELKAKGLTTTYKTGGSPVTDADMAVDELLKTRLLAARPNYGWLSEETVDDAARLPQRRVFVVDPIDGTRAYVAGKPWWVVSIAVVDKGLSAAGVVFAPDLDETYAAAAGKGATLNGQPICASAVDQLEGCGMIGDKAFFAHKSWRTPWPPMRIESRNATAYRFCLIASGAFDGAVVLAPKADWDVAAGDLIAREAGAHVSDHKGRAYAYNRPHPWQASMVCAAPALAPLILARTRPIDLPSSNP